MQLIGLTVAEAIAKIQKYEGNKTYMIYVCIKSHQKRDFKKFYKRNHFYDENGKRAYRIVEQDVITFAKHKTEEYNNFIIDAEIRKGEHINMSFSGATSNGTHNEYYLFLTHLQKGNKGNKIYENKHEQIIQFKDGELTKAQRRFTL